MQWSRGKGVGGGYGYEAGRFWEWGVVGVALNGEDFRSNSNAPVTSSLSLGRTVWLVE